MIRHLRLRRIPIVALTLASLALAACDPVVNIAGANFPAWLLCAIVGAVLAAAFRPGFVATRIEPYLGPLILIYPCLAILLGCVTYLIFFSRT
jgi:YtcA family